MNTVHQEASNCPSSATLLGLASEKDLPLHSGLMLLHHAEDPFQMMILTTFNQSYFAFLNKMLYFKLKQNRADFKKFSTEVLMSVLVLSWQIMSVCLHSFLIIVADSDSV